MTAEEEIAEVDKALEETDSIKPINVHLKPALELFAAKKNPDEYDLMIFVPLHQKVSNG